MCNTCGQPAAPTRSNKCEQRLTLDYVPGTGCTIGATFDGITSTLDLSRAIKSCETRTVMQFNTDKCRIEFLDEQYLSSGGTLSFVQSIPAKTIASCINLKDLADVADTDPEQCDLLVWADDGCGAGCSGPGTGWRPYTIPKVSEVNYVVGTNAEGCLVKLDDPTDPLTDPLGNNESCRILVHSGNTASWYALPDDGTSEVNDAVVVSVNENGCLVTKTLELDPCIMQGMFAQGYTPNPYSGIWTTPANTGSYSNKQYGPIMGSPTYTNSTNCPQYVRLDAFEFICSTASDGGPYNFALGLSVESNLPDVNGDTQAISWEHLVNQAGTSYGSYQRITVFGVVNQVILVAPGQTVNWTVRTFRANFGSTSINNDDGTSAGDTNRPGWTIQAWRAN